MNFRRPMIPATTGPLWSPMRRLTGIPVLALDSFASSIIRRAIDMVLSAWSSQGSGRPQTAM